MRNSHDSHEGSAGTNSGIWVIVLVVVFLALLVVPVLLVLGFVGFRTQTRVDVAPAVLSEIGTTNNSASSSVANLSVNGATATVTSNGVTVTAVADSGQWNNSQVNSTGSRVEAKLDNQTIVLENSRLNINNVDYGAVQQGDQVRFEGGRVTVNGQERTPAEGAASNSPTSEPERETTEKAP
jgi:hypothetical protein